MYKTASSASLLQAFNFSASCEGSLFSLLYIYAFNIISFFSLSLCDNLNLHFYQKFSLRLMVYFVMKVLVHDKISCKYFLFHFYHRNNVLKFELNIKSKSQQVIVQADSAI